LRKSVFIENKPTAPFLAGQTVGRGGDCCAALAGRGTVEAQRSLLILRAGGRLGGKLADRSLSPSLLAHTRRLSRCREEAGVQHNRQEAHHRQDERPTPGGGTGSARRRAAHAAACSAAIKRSWGQEPGRKDPKATSRGHGGGSITRSDRHPPARTRPTRGQARQPKRGTISASAASEHAHADRIRSVPEPSAEPGVHEPMASAHCDRD